MGTQPLDFVVGFVVAPAAVVLLIIRTMCVRNRLVFAVGRAFLPGFMSMR